MPPRVALAIAALALAYAASGQAVEFRDSKGELRLDPSIPGSHTCVIKPTALRVAEDCAGLEVDAAARTLQPNVLVSAISRFPDGLIALTVTTQSSSGQAMTEEDARELIDGARAAGDSSATPVVIHGRESGSAGDRLIINGAQVVRFIMEMPSGAGGLDRAVTHVVVARHEAFTIVVVGSSKQLARLLAAADTIVSTVHVTPPNGPVKWRSKNYWLGYHLAQALLGVGMLAGICVGLVLLVRRLGRRGRTQSSGPGNADSDDRLL